MKKLIFIYLAVIIIKVFVAIKKHTFTILSILLLSVFIASCSKDDGIARPPFTTDQLGWINNLVNPKYRCVTKTINTQGDTIITIDTLVAHTNTTNYLLNGTISGDNIAYYEGCFYFTLWYSINIDINNYSDFIAKLTVHNTYDITHYSTDTAMINGNIYHDVYKFSNLPPQNYFKNLYFIKNIGFLYLEQANGNYATIIQ